MSGNKKRKEEDEVPLHDWVHAIVQFKERQKVTPALSQLAFLRSEASGSKFTEKNKNRFSKYLRKYEKGELVPSMNKRYKHTKFPTIEAKLIEYINLRSRLYQQDKCGVTYCLLQQKCLLWAEHEDIPNFKASPGWISKMLNRNGKTAVRLHGEGAELSPEEADQALASFLKEFHLFLEEKNIKACCLYNADQTGLFFQKLPNTLYVDMESKKKFRGCKQMKDKTRVTLMICTAANGDKIPIAFVGISENPHCFREGTPPLPYIHQKNAWFDKSITRWWLNSVLLPYHFLKHGRNVPCVVLLDNCSAHKLDDAEFETFADQKIFIKFLPPNLTSKCQPADMGMIAALKVGYKVTYLKSLLDIFDVEGGYEFAAARRRHQPRGCKGLAYGGKPTVLDAMEIIHNIWVRDGKYAETEGIQRCWRKANILPPSWNQTINNEVGSKSMPNKKKTITEEQCDELCSLLQNIKLKATEASVDTKKHASVLDQSIISELDSNTLQKEEWKEMVENWVMIEDDLDIQNEEVNEVLDSMDKKEVVEDDEGNESDASSTLEVPTTKADALKALDIALKYAREIDATDAIRYLHKAEHDLMQKRREKENIQRPMTFYFQAKPKAVPKAAAAAAAVAEQIEELSSVEEAEIIDVEEI